MKTDYMRDLFLRGYKLQVRRKQAAGTDHWTLVSKFNQSTAWVQDFMARRLPDVWDFRLSPRTFRIGFTLCEAQHQATASEPVWVLDEKQFDLVPAFSGCGYRSYGAALEAHVAVSKNFEFGGLQPHTYWFETPLREATLTADIANGTAVILSLVVWDEKHYKQGFGTALVRDLLALCIELGTHNCRVLAEAEAVPFYTRLGFVPVPGASRRTLEWTAPTPSSHTHN